MLKRCLIAVFFGVFVLIAGPQAQGPKNAFALSGWTGANTTCPDNPGIRGLQGICASVKEACESWVAFYGYEFKGTKPTFSTGHKLRGFHCILIRQTVNGPVDAGVETKPTCDTGYAAPLSNTGCADFPVREHQVGRPADACSLSDGGGSGKPMGLGKSDSIGPGNIGLGNWPDPFKRSHVEVILFG
ncbi:MAG: hypothetical protein OEO83_12300 [Alphaproteobacteria bacterium]|nr:hypothetical protein [Alphaproteobacteria bacterium]